MGVIISSISQIDNLRFDKLRKGHVTKAARVLLLDDGVAIVELATGAFTVVGRRHSPDGNWAVLGYGLDKFTGSVLDGLVRFGILTKSQVSEHKKHVQARHDANERKYAIERLKSACETLGIEMPALAKSGDPRNSKAI